MAGTRKRGRPHKPYRTTDGQYINGLRRRKDGRWVIVGTGKTFVEPDERRAVLRYQRWEAEQQRESIVDLSVPVEMFQSRAGVEAAMEAGAMVSGYADGTYGVEVGVPEPVLWDWMRKQLIERPEHAARQTGIAEVARLADLPPSQPSPTLASTGKLYFEKAPVQRKQRRQMQLFWDDFCRWMKKQGVETLRQLTPALCAEYGDHVQTHGDSPKYVRNRFGGIRAILNFARRRGLHPADVRHALDCCAVLVAPRQSVTRDPQPISREVFSRLLACAETPRMRGFLLSMLNLCMYPGEALNLDWDEVNLERQVVVTSRSKTGVIRVGVLWDRTAEVLASLKVAAADSNTPVFTSRRGTRWHVGTAGDQFRKLRRAAGVNESVKAEQFRDGAYTAAIEAGVELLQTKLLAGHTTGISDHYAQRRPEMVRDAVVAIERAYFG